MPEDYVHRIGRTARAGHKGHAVSLVCIDEKKLLADIEKLLQTSIRKETIPGYEPDPRISAEPITRGRQPQSQGRKNGSRKKSRRKSSRSKSVILIPSACCSRRSCSNCCARGGGRGSAAACCCREAGCFPGPPALPRRPCRRPSRGDEEAGSATHAAALEQDTDIRVIQVNQTGEFDKPERGEENYR